MKSLTMEQRLQALEDKAALKTLVDTFSNLADEKDVEAQIMLFIEDATVDSYIDGTLLSSVKGRSEILHAFHNYLSMLETVYHLNGQQMVEVNGDSATGHVLLPCNAYRDRGGKRGQERERRHL